MLPVEPETTSAPDSSAPRRERRDAAAHSQRILSVAQQLFEQHGVDATSMHDIARTAGVGQATLYRRYAHKGELCLSLLDAHFMRFQAETDMLIRESAATPALELLLCVLERLVRFNRESAVLLTAIVESACGTRRHEAYKNPFYRWIRATTHNLLQRAVDQGETGPLDVAVAVDFVLAPFAIDLWMYQRNVLGYSDERIIASARQILLHGLRARV